jgi:hypothetical protein
LVTSSLLWWRERQKAVLLLFVLRLSWPTSSRLDILGGSNYPEMESTFWALSKLLG